MLLSSLLLSTALLAQTATFVPNPRTVNVTGEAIQYVTPDEAILRVGVETFAPELSASTSSNDSRGAGLIQALRAAGIEEKDIQADHADLEIVYQRDGIAQGVAGYRMRRAYSITLRDVKKLDGVVRLALKSGANHLDGYELRTSQLRKYRDEVRKRAIGAAR
ncbi:MAG TPA: SIMPL domain-containing protein, partial [Thermoanaerobaculia bacterium]